MNRKIRIMMVEDHPEYRDIVEFALNKEPDMEIVGQFGTSERALRSMRGCEDRKEPDVILLDLHLPGMNGLEAIPCFSTEFPEARIIILTQSDREDDLLQAIMLGANGYLLKSSTVKQLTEGIRTVMDGGASLDSKLAKFVLTTLKNKMPPSEIDQLLTKRELEVLSLLAEGCVKKEIADKLGISLTTVVSHVTHIYSKLHAPNAPAAIAKAFQLGILPLDGMN
ncbi:response regulator [Haloferula sp.]|uniref:response regulator n=1 Tax=Haloferula sp. TaxID=2497595 RepID=UPI003C78665D